MHHRRARPLLAACLALLSVATASCGGDDDAASPPLPTEIRQVFEQPRYRDATWGLRVVDIDSGEVLHDWNAGRRFLIGSVRKNFSVALALDALGPDHVFRTPVHRQGSVDASGVLAGELILVASGDMAMGGRTNPDGSYAIGDLDHNEANALGNAVLTAPDPLAGFDALAAQVAAAGITRVGNVAIDDRLFEPFDFREEFQLKPILVNDNVVDVVIDSQAAVDWRPKSAAFGVQSSLVAGAAGNELELEFDPELPGCIGAAGCVGHVSGSLPADFVPPLTGAFPLVRTFRITEPSNYARTVFIEALARAGVAVDAAAVAPNPVAVLPARNAYTAATQVAELVSHPYKDHAKHVMKVSYNIGADLSLMLFGLTQGVDTLPAALAAEQQVLSTQFGITAADVHFIDGSGGGDTAATGAAVTTLLAAMSKRPSFADYLAAHPLLGVDGSLAFVTDFEADPSLAGAKGQVHGKTGTYVELTAQGPVYRAQSLAGYIFTKGGRRLAFSLVVNDVGVLSGIEDVLPVFQDEGTIAAILWKLH